MDFTGLFCACNQAISLGQCGMGESESYDPMALAAEVQGIESRPLKQKPLVSQTCKNQASVVPRAACNLMFLHAACGQGFSVKGLMAARKKILNSLTKSTRLVLADCESGGLSCGQWIDDAQAFVTAFSINWNKNLEPVGFCGSGSNLAFMCKSMWDAFFAVLAFPSILPCNRLLTLTSLPRAFCFALVSLHSAAHFTKGELDFCSFQ